MLTKEQFEKEIVRMWDSVRINGKGTSECFYVICKDCPICDLCISAKDSNAAYNAFSIVEAVEKWSKEHPIKTNGQVLEELIKEKFNVDVNISGCVGFSNPKGCATTDWDCDLCPHKGFWDKEYKGDNKE